MKILTVCNFLLKIEIWFSYTFFRDLNQLSVPVISSLKGPPPSMHWHQIYRSIFVNSLEFSKWGSSECGLQLFCTSWFSAYEVMLTVRFFYFTLDAMSRVSHETFYMLLQIVLIMFMQLRLPLILSSHLPLQIWNLQ